MKQYLDAVKTILNEGTRKENRTGVDTLSTFGVHYNIDLREGFPLLTTKKINWKNIVVENLWFLSGEPNIDLLRKHGCKFWDAWADEDGRVPSAYGNFWRRFPVHSYTEDGGVVASPVEVLGNTHVRDMSPVGFNDQIEWVVNELKRNPMSRRLVVSAWAPGNAQTSKLPPCHIQFILNTQNLRVQTQCSNCDGEGEVETSDGLCASCDGIGAYRIIKPHLCLHLTQRSCDIGLGVPYNIAGYAFLLELFSRFTGIPAGIFSHTLVDAHAYTSKPDGSMSEYDHVPGLRDQLAREPRKLPRLKIASRIQNLDDINQVLPYETEDLLQLFQLEGYDPHPAISFKVAV